MEKEEAAKVDTEEGSKKEKKGDRTKDRKMHFNKQH